MPSITLKSISESLYRQLKDIARSHHRSLTQELVVALETYVQEPKAEKRLTLDRIRLLRDRYKPTISDRDIKGWKESGRP